MPTRWLLCELMLERAVFELLPFSRMKRLEGCCDLEEEEQRVLLKQSSCRKGRTEVTKSE